MFSFYSQPEQIFYSILWLLLSAMNSGNWREKRTHDWENGEIPDDSDTQLSPSLRRSRQPSNQSRRTQTSSWGAANENSRPLHQGGRNLTKEEHTQVQPRTRPKTRVAQAIDEGRRLYVGNLPYSAKREDVEGLLGKEASLVQGISMSVDSETRRNLSYCFVDMESRDAAESTIRNHDGQMFKDRALKVKPGVKVGTGTGRYHLKRREPGESAAPHGHSPQGFRHWERPSSTLTLEEINTTAKLGRGLHVGRFSGFSNQSTTNEEVQDLLQDCDMAVVSELLSPHPFEQSGNGNKHHSSVGLRTKSDADRVIRSLNGVCNILRHCYQDSKGGCWEAP
ncbi:hypothetical protein B0J14DRAFT_596165 [Halenospora varia]|nr:hypothetical protein B0J14DRAFT_596165 [Halenospora varia]